MALENSNPSRLTAWQHLASDWSFGRCAVLAPRRTVRPSTNSTGVGRVTTDSDNHHDRTWRPQPLLLPTQSVASAIEVRLAVDKEGLGVVAAIRQRRRAHCPHRRRVTVHQEVQIRVHRFPWFRLAKERCSARFLSLHYPVNERTV
jgi:hypothetical protein